MFKGDAQQSNTFTTTDIGQFTENLAAEHLSQE